jgi:class 3 adenylate cyclase
MAQAYRAEGDGEAAALDLQAAKSAFERLGAVPDAQGAASLLAAAAEGTSTGAPTARATRTFMFTDICASTNLLEAIGDEAWEDLLRWHDQTLRSLFVQQGGEEIKHAGDGFFVAFSDATAALGCAAAIQRTLADHRRTQGFAPQVRIGLHTAEATRRGRDYGGKAVHQAARIASLAEAGEVLASEETLSAAPDGLCVSAPRAVNLKGFAKPVRVAAIEWR